MHFNENFGRAQATTKSGKERIQITFPKHKHGDFAPKIVPVEKTYGEFNPLRTELILILRFLHISNHTLISNASLHHWLQR